ncbi:MAG: glycosyl transferase family 36 [Deltaproteobacteria bacterium]|nr:glycosyl transferase family 36 [Deltaproteobacteria bacterium]
MKAPFSVSHPILAGLSYCAALILYCGAMPLVYAGHPFWIAEGPLPPSHLVPALAMAPLGLVCAWTLCLVATGHRPTIGQSLLDMLVPTVLTLASHREILIWQAPTHWMDLLTLSPICATFMALAHISLLTVSMAKNGRHPSAVAQTCLLMSPFLFNWLLLLQTPSLLQTLGAPWTDTSIFGPRGSELAGRVIVLLVFNISITMGINALCIRALPRGARPYLLPVACAFYAGLTPLIADLGATPEVAALPAPLGAIVATLTVAAAQAGLWGETFLMTGLLMDALKGRRPTGYWGMHYYREGLGKGAAYSALFLGLLFVVQFLGSSNLFLAAHLVQPLLVSLLLGTAAMPLAKTILESFDGSRPFFIRLANSYREPRLYARGAILGLGLYLMPLAVFIHKDEGTRFLLGVLLGAMTHGGANLILDGIDIVRGPRMRLQSWRVYLTGALLGGFVGGAIAWYLDPSQTAVIVNKFQLYTTLHQAGATDYVIYPLFSKWGAMNLGPHTGSARILFNESVSGVINWSLAAPLFSVNLFFLTALFTRSLTPIRMLASRDGMIAVAEQTVRVLRWGLWMAPVIYSLLRISPDPTWYNQDGAIRTLAAIWQSIALTPEAFRGWSIQTFMYLLAYDWFRILIWLDHMGLRVATLVNLSFVGGDALDELLARFQGHPGRTRCIPEALRRFATWAPLLIPFFLPMGADWGYVWDTAESIQKTGQGQASPLAVLVVLFLIGGTITALVSRARAKRQAKPRANIGLACGLDRPGYCPPDEIILHNGVYTVIQGRDGRGYSRVFSAVRHGREYDLTNRPVSRAHSVGKFLYLHEDGAAPWTLGCRPIRRRDVNVCVESTGPLSLRMTGSCQGITVRADISLLPDKTVELCRVRLTNTAKHPRQLELTSYREICLNDPNPQLRHPFYNRQHIATWFVPELTAILGRNRILKTDAAKAQNLRPSPEVYLHAAHIPADQTHVRVIGYEDNRGKFIGDTTLHDPEGLVGPTRALDDRDLRYTFDPIASLRLGVRLEPGQSAEFLLLDGYAPSAEDGARQIQELFHLPETPIVHPTVPAGPSRDIQEPSLEAMLRPPVSETFRFSDTGEELHLGWKTPRRWAHLMTNELGYGLLATNDGALSSFMGNSQQNALTPFAPDSMSVQTPGQIFYLKDIATGEIFSPTYVPFRDKTATHDVTFGLGHCVFRMRRGYIDTELTAFVLPDQPVEARLLRIRNASSTPKTYVVTFCAQIVLAEVPVDSIGQIETDTDAKLGALFFNRPENRYHQGWAFVASSLPVCASETSLNRFLGEGRDFSDPCMVICGGPDPDQDDDGYRVAALSGTITVPAGGEARMHVLIGQDRTIQSCRERIRALAADDSLDTALAHTKAWWRSVLGVIRVDTDSPAFDRLVNCWLPYQILNARLWGRLGPHQRSGAYGFRDQLQDVLPLVYLRPDQARAQILLHAGQQFHEGDVLQWWHKTWDGKTGLGMRNRASDPHLWLPYLTCRYVEASGDRSILDERIAYLEGRSIPHGEEGIAFVPRPSRDDATLYAHCLRALNTSLNRLGKNGLPLMGAHDWNDGLSAVGVDGTGTSVWLGFFLHDVLRTMIPLIEERDGRDMAQKFTAKAERLRLALARQWRDDHFIRAVTDNGEALDYADALCSAWPLLSKATDRDHGQTALVSGLKQLEKNNLALLLSPWFDENATPYPGRIADYPPGVRENGAQYSHGASWLVDALAELAHIEAQTGDATQAKDWREQALRVWLKISPLAHTLPDELETYGLPPHQQPADIFHGPGYEGRGGWSWYTGAAARMLWAAYRMLGIGLRGGRPEISPTLLEAQGALKVQQVRVHGVTVFSAHHAEETDGE